jgi:outer membrane immunogenic protein
VAPNEEFFEMRHTFIVIGALGVGVLAAGNALAADYGAPSANYWDGLYLGLQGDYAKATADFTAPGETVPFGSLALQGWAGGARIGVDIQTGALVVGVLGDLMAGKITANVADFGGGGSDVSANIDWLGTVRGRVGMAFNNLLVYGTGGVAFAHVNATVTNLAPGDLGSGSTSVQHTGWTAGLGAELALTSNVSMYAEWLYADYGTQNYHFQDAAGTLDADTHLKSNSVLFGVNLRFR